MARRNGNYRWLNYPGGRSRNQVADALPEAVLRRSLGLRAEKIRSMYRESDIVPGEQTATSILKQRTKNLAPLPHAHQQQNPPQEKTVVSIAVDPESPESLMKRPKRRRWVNEKYTRWVKTQPCACCGKPADDPHHLIGHGQGGIGTKAHDISRYRCAGSITTNFMLIRWHLKKSMVPRLI
ncbi:putative prophage protein [Escherichia coli]|uniref:Putative prophage protein n=1 Tax=Escherichia coli TaxID=562 RepID=A0A376UBY1_ECOLX|nr:putative prophage protein [Escherichia coli]